MRIFEGGISSGTRILILLVLVAGTATITGDEWESLLLWGPLAIAGSAVAKVPVRRIALLVCLMVPFVFLAMIQLFTGGGADSVPIVAGPVMLSFHPSRIGSVALVIARSLVALVFAVSLGNGIDGDEFADFLAGARVPAFMVMSLAVMLNYSRCFRADMERLFAAARMREPSGDYTGRLVLAARSVGIIFLRALERSERLHAAMLARGYDASLDESRRSTRIDPVPVALVVIIVVATRLVAREVSV